MYKGASLQKDSEKQHDFQQQPAYMKPTNLPQYKITSESSQTFYKSQKTCLPIVAFVERIHCMKKLYA